MKILMKIIVKCYAGERLQLKRFLKIKKKELFRNLNYIKVN